MKADYTSVPRQNSFDSFKTSSDRTTFPLTDGTTAIIVGGGEGGGVKLGS